ncbi:hypothetical protein B296_00006564 [Ensete ventricosum]|uniref:Uncharacterized protein n=1 Tax=Ensete ventricosum TaxID=4639 RepID=A0A427B373_ENSVE|nr:hypothetical protein B296_00006564 [Ensete ventricosum]
MIVPTEEPKFEATALEHKEKDTPQSATRTVPTLTGYTNPLKLKIEGFFKQQPVIVLIDTESTQLHKQDKFFLKSYILPNSPWLLMQYFKISGDFHDFPQDRTMMLKVFLNDDLQPTTQDHEKIESRQWQNQSKGRIICKTQQSMNIIPLTMKKDAPRWPSGTLALTTMMSSTPNRGQMFIIGVDTSRVGISITLMQDDQLLIRIEDFSTFYTRCLKEILIATKLKVWLDIGP